MEENQDSAMIDKVKDYIDTCPYLEDFKEANINYLVDKVKAYSVNESAGYNPIINSYVLGSDRQFLFTIDAKLHWNEDIQNNIDNSKTFENIRNWLEANTKAGNFPEIEGAYKIEATTNGYIFATNADEAIYRIQCKLEYYKED